MDVLQFYHILKTDADKYFSKHGRWCNVSESNDTNGNISCGSFPTEFLHPPYTLGGAEMYLAISFLLVTVIGAPANAFVSYLAFEILTHRSKRRHEGHWFIFSMTLWDLLFCCIFAPMVFLQLFHAITMTEVLCQFQLVCQHATTFGSSASLLLLNVDKFVRICKPLHYPLMVTRRRAIAVIVGANIFCILCTILLHFVTGTMYEVHRNVCFAKYSGKMAFIGLSTVFFVLPPVVSMAISAFIASIVKKQRGGFRFDSSADRTEVSLGETSSIGGVEQVRLNQRCPREPGKRSKAIGFVFTTTLFTVFTTVPYRLYYMYSVNASYDPDMQINILLTILYIIMVFNAPGNPFITMATQYQYTNGMKAVYRKICGNNGNRLEGQASAKTKSTFLSSARRHSTRV